MGCFSNRSDVISGFSIHILFPSLNICLTFPMGTGCFRKTLRGQPSPQPLSAPLWAPGHYSGSSFSSSHCSRRTTPTTFPPGPLSLGGGNQSKLDIGQTEQMIWFPQSLKTGSLKQHEDDPRREVARKETLTLPTAFQGS